MRTTSLSALLFTALALAAGNAQAQKMKPGLWEYTTAMNSGGGEMAAAMAGMQQELAKMPPEQRRQMEAMMAQRGMGMGAQGTSVRMCVTADQAARDQVPMSEGRCRQTRQSRSGNTVRFAFTCEGEHAGSGEGEYTFVSATEGRGTVRMTSTRKGQTETMEMQTGARWLGADCGEIKPRP